MSELFGFLTGIVFSGWFVLGLIIVAVLFDHNERNGWAAITAIGAILIIGNINDLGWSSMGMMMLAYVPAGIVWSFWRWRMHCSKIKMKMQSSSYNDERDVRINASHYKEMVKASKNIDNILSWILSWPISILSSVLGDMIDIVERLIRERLIGIYSRISLNTINEIDKIEREMMSNLDTELKEVKPEI